MGRIPLNMSIDVIHIFFHPSRMHIDPIRNTKMSKSELGDKCVICDHQGILSR
ncbi:hypothetical protein VAE308_200001 [Vibrio aestuarianus]|uniref:Uncharacterized protein n=1 Tax=Vibrio aestuarianus TaxID=28171 RepID=A0ABM9FLD1_9VIBR|nr:hypothetical protein VAE063_840001 [Vibrio aestuarianus]CAH8232636.1 hypothetical protein VAE308_200001 [Vibrio aestuarianus]